MAVAAPSTIGANPYLNPNLAGLTPALGEVGGDGLRQPPEAAEQIIPQELAVIDLKTALDLMDSVAGGLKAKPGWLALRVHNPHNPSLLGASYA